MPDKKLLKSDYVLQHAPCGFLSFCADGTVVQINQTLLKWLKLSQEDVLQQKKFPDLLNNGAKLYYHLYVMPLLNIQGHVNEIAFDLFSSDGTKIPCLLNACAIKDEMGKIDIIHASLFNITDRKKYEAELLYAKKEAEDEKKRFEFFANELPNMVWTSSPFGAINFRNSHLIDFFSEMPEQLSVRYLRSVIHPDDWLPALQLWIAAARQTKIFEAQLRLLNARGEYIWFLARILPFTDEKSQLTMWLGSCTNIHEQQQEQISTIEYMKQNITNAFNLVDEKVKVLREVAFDQSHLVRSPLSKIMGLTMLLENKATDPETRHLIALLCQSSKELDGIINEIVKKTYNPA